MFKDHKRFCEIRLAPNCPPWPELQRHMWLSLRNRKTIRKLGTIRGMAAACRRTIFIPDDSLGSPAPKEWCLCTRQKSQVALFEEILTMSTTRTVKNGFALKLLLKFIYSEKATKFCKISTIDLFYVVTVKSTVEILQNFMAFSEYMNFKAKKRLKFTVVIIQERHEMGILRSEFLTFLFLLRFDLETVKVS